MTLTTSRPSGAKPKRLGSGNRAIHGGRWQPYFLVGPALLYLFFLQGIPLLQEMRLSVSETSLLNPRAFHFVGLHNFIALISDPTFGNALRVTAIYVSASVFCTIAIGMGAALLMDRSFPGRPVARSLLIIPWAAPPVAVALIATWMLNAQYGIINRGLAAIDLLPESGLWLDSPRLALLAILGVTTWQLFPFAAVVILAALQAVPPELREAALIDGAGRFALFRAVVWPVIRPITFILALLMTIWAIRRFELIWLMTQGGPVGATNTLAIDLYRLGFVINDLGSAAAVGMVGMAFSMTVTMIYFVFTSRLEKQA